MKSRHDSQAALRGVVSRPEVEVQSIPTIYLTRRLFVENFPLCFNLFCAPKPLAY
jgi:hypothetical protein